MPTLPALTLRFACDQTLRKAMPNVGSTTDVIVYKGNPYQVQAALFSGPPSVDTFVSDLTNITGATLTVRKNRRTGTLIATKTLANSDIDKTVSYANWISGTRQHFLFQLSETETNQVVPSDGTLDIFGDITLTTGSGPLDVGFFKGVIKQSGSIVVGDPPVVNVLSFIYRPDLNTATLPTLSTIGRAVGSRVDILENNDTILSYVLESGAASLGSDKQPNDQAGFHWALCAGTGGTTTIIGITSAVTSVSGGATGLTFSDPTGDAALTGTLNWTSLNKTGSSLADLTARAWSALTGTPTTLSGYGITDAQPLDTDLTAIAALTTTSFARGILALVDGPAVVSYIGAGSGSFTGAFADLTGKPTTLSGYGITDAQPLDSDLTAIAALTTTSFARSLLTQADAAAVRSYIGAGAASFSGAFVDLSGKPTTLSGYGITDAQPLDSDLTSIASLTTTSFGRGFLTQSNGAGVRTYIGAGTSSFDGIFASLTSKPTTVSGYGITDAQPLDSDLTAIAALTTTSFGRGALALTDAASFRSYIGAGASGFSGSFVDLSNKPTTLAGYGITDAQPLDSDLSAIAALVTTSFGRGTLVLTDAGSFRSYIGAGASSFSGAFVDLTGKPTTVAGYGITDALTPTNSATVTNKSIAATQLTGVVASARLGTGGDSSGTHFLADDQTFKGVSAVPTVQSVGNVTTVTVTAGKDLVVFSTPLTASCLLTLPAASGYSNVKQLRIVDVPAVTTASNTLTIQRAGSDLLNGVATSVLIGNGGNVYAILTSDGVSNWSLIAAARELPSVSGQSGNLLSNDGTTTLWTPNVAYNALSTISDVEEFDFGTLVGWSVGGGTSSFVASEAGHPGIIRLNTTASSGTVCYLTRSSVATFVGSDTFEETFTLRLNTNDANTTFRFGLSSDPTSATPVAGAFFEKLAADTAWFCVTRSASTQTRTATTFSVTTSFLTFKVRRIDGSTIGFTVGANTEQTLTTNLPTVGLIPFVQITNTAAAAKTCDVDFARTVITGVSR